MAVFRLDRLLMIAKGVVMIVLRLRFSTPLVQVDAISERQVAALDLSDRLVDEGMERGYVRIIDLPCRASHEIVAEGQVVRFAQTGNCVILRLQHLGNHDLCE